MKFFGADVSIVSLDNIPKNECALLSPADKDDPDALSVKFGTPLGERTVYFKGVATKNIKIEEEKMSAEKQLFSLGYVTRGYRDSLSSFREIVEEVVGELERAKTELVAVRYAMRDAALEKLVHLAACMESVCVGMDEMAGTSARVRIVDGREGTQETEHDNG